jgi:hypothetical protein
VAHTAVAVALKKMILLLLAQEAFKEQSELFGEMAELSLQLAQQTFNSLIQYKYAYST